MAGEAPEVLLVAGMTRSGSTILEKALGTHRDVGFISRLHGRFPRLHPLAGLARVFDRPRIAAPLFTFDGWLSPTEAFRIYDRMNPRFSENDLDASDADGRQTRRWHRFGRRLLRLQGRRTWVLKYTGWSRLAYMAAVFPRVRVVWTSRDPVAVGWSNHGFGWWKAVAAHHGVDVRDPAANLPFQVALAERLDAVGKSDLTRLGLPHVLVAHAGFVADRDGELARVAALAGLSPDGFEARYLERLKVSRERSEAVTSRRTERDLERLREGLGKGASLDLTPWRRAP